VIYDKTQNRVLNNNNIIINIINVPISKAQNKLSSVALMADETDNVFSLQ